MTSHGDWLFVQIPLTGSTSLTEVIGYGGWNGHAYKHYTAQEHRDRLGAETYDKLRVFTIVRNPFDRLVSLCAFIRKPTHVLEPEEFQLWLSTDFNHPPLLYPRQPQAKILTLSQVGFLNAESIGIARHECFEHDVRWIVDQVGMADGDVLHRLARSNWTRRFGDYRLYYNDKTIERVSELYAEDLQRFGYAFE